MREGKSYLGFLRISSNSLITMVTFELIILNAISPASATSYLENNFELGKKEFYV